MIKDCLPPNIAFYMSLYQKQGRKFMNERWLRSGVFVPTYLYVIWLSLNLKRSIQL